MNKMSSLYRYPFNYLLVSSLSSFTKVFQVLLEYDTLVKLWDFEEFCVELGGDRLFRT